LGRIDLFAVARRERTISFSSHDGVGHGSIGANCGPPQA
jgi:hypothetical protein